MHRRAMIMMTAEEVLLDMVDMILAVMVLVVTDIKIETDSLEEIMVGDNMPTSLGSRTGTGGGTTTTRCTDCRT